MSGITAIARGETQAQIKAHDIEHTPNQGLLITGLADLHHGRTAVAATHSFQAEFVGMRVTCSKRMN
jgi:hypothetical protein